MGFGIGQFRHFAGSMNFETNPPTSQGFMGKREPQKILKTDGAADLGSSRRSLRDRFLRTQLNRTASVQASPKEAAACACAVAHKGAA